MKTLCHLSKVLHALHDGVARVYVCWYVPVPGIGIFIVPSIILQFHHRLKQIKNNFRIYSIRFTLFYEHMDLDACVHKMPNNFSHLLAGGNHPLLLFGRGDHGDATASLIDLTAFLQDGGTKKSHFDRDILTSVDK